MRDDRPAGDPCSRPPMDRSIGRRAALAGAAGLCLGLMPRLARAEVAPEAARARPQPGDVLVRVDDGKNGPLLVGEIPIGEGPILAWPLDPASSTLRSGSRLNKVLVLRLDAEGFDSQTRDNAADGVLAYSAICPHTGCELGKWLAEAQLIECPCHFSHYDPKAGAKVLSGPSPRRLAALPLTADGDGRLVVAKPFVGRVGIQQQT